MGPTKILKNYNVYLRVFTLKKVINTNAFLKGFELLLILSAKQKNKNKKTQRNDQSIRFHGQLLYIVCIDA